MQHFSFLISFLAGVAGSMGFGSGTVLLVYLTVGLQMEQQTAQGVNLLFFIPCAVLSLLIYRKRGMVSLNRIAPLLLSALPGAVCGYLLLGFLSTALLRRFFGGFLVLLAIREWYVLLRQKQTGTQSDSAPEQL